MGRVDGAGPIARSLTYLALVLGLLHGFAEATEVVLLDLVPGALSWRNANSIHVLWFAPLFYGAAFGVVGVGVAGVAALARRVAPGRAARLPWDAALVLLLVAASVFLAVTLPGRFVADWAAAVLALGVGTVGARLYRRHRATVRAYLPRLGPALGAAVAVAGLAVIGGTALRERAAMAGLPAAPEAPNVLLIVMDTQRADRLSAYGYGRPTSPGLDRLADEGTLFEAAYASSPWTLPTHATMMTGRLPSEHEAGELRRPYMDDRHRTLAEALRARGWATGGFVANTFWCGRTTGLDRGFVRYEDFYGNLPDAAVRTVLGRRLAYEVLPHVGLVDVPGRKWAEDVNRDLLAWIDGLGDRPWFAFANYFDVHGPYLPPAPYDGRFSGTPSAHRASGEIEIGALTGDIELPSPERLRALNDAYDESILYLDAQLDSLFAALERRGVLDNTLVVVTSDHGESFGEHGFMYHGHSLYRDQLHVPLILRLPGRVPEGRRVAAAVGLDRIPATVAGLVGLGGESFPGRPLEAAWSASTAFHGAPAPGQPPAGPAATDARRASGAAAGSDGRERSERPVVAEVDRRSLVPASWPSSRGWSKAALTARWHLILRESGETELYDVREDPGELRNLAGAPRHADVLTRLRGALPDLGDAAPVAAGGGGREEAGGRP